MLPVYVINLDRSVARWEIITRRLRELGIEPNRLRAVDGGKGEHLRFANVPRHFRYGIPLAAGEFGCFASHYVAWNRCVLSGQPLVVLEDDAVVSDRLPQAMKALSDLLGPVPYLRLEATLDRPHRHLRRAPGGFDLVQYRKGPLGTVAYALTPAAASKFIAGARWWREPVDAYMDRYWVHGVECFGLAPFPVTFDPQDESIKVGLGAPKGWNRFRWKVERFADNVPRILYSLPRDLRWHGGHLVDEARRLAYNLTRR